MRSGGTTLHPLGAETEQGQQVGEIHETFRLAFFGDGLRSPLVLFVQQRLEPLGDPFGQAELRQVAGHFDFELDGLRHIAFQFLRQTLANRAAVIQAARSTLPFLNYERSQRSLDSRYRR